MAEEIKSSGHGLFPVGSRRPRMEDCNTHSLPMRLFFKQEYVGVSQCICRVFDTSQSPKPELISADPVPINDTDKPARNPKTRPVVPAKPKAFVLNSGNHALLRPCPVVRAQSVNFPPINAPDQPHSITLVDLEDDDGIEYGTEHSTESFRIDDEAIGGIEPAITNPLDRVRQQTMALSNSLVRDIQSLKNVPPTPPKPQELGQKFAATFNPLFGDAKRTIGKATQPIGNMTQKGLDSVRNETATRLEKSGITGVFMKTGDDFADAAAKIQGKEGLCSKCKTLPLHACFPLTTGQAVTQTELEWAIPLSRTIYHADWCRFCRLLLEMLCLPTHDPLQHPAVKPHMQSEIQNYSMKRWVSQGWEDCDKKWPFGHGEKRHEGASYILGPLGAGVKDRLVGVALASFSLAGVVGGWNVATHGLTRMLNQEYAHRKQLDWAKNPNKHPLSCVLTISIKTHLSNHSPGMLFVNLIGYGRGLGASLQSLSSFRLRAVQSGPFPGLPALLSRPEFRISGELDHLAHSEPSETLVALGARKPFTYGRLLDKKWIDPSIGKTWLSECEQHHGSRCSQHGWDVAMRKPVSLRAIDVHNLCLCEIQDPAKCRFISLSYVWGGARTLRLQYSNIDILMTKNGLLRYIHDLPRTILDAMEVVKAMGERWLWVDSICILQENTQEAHEQIASMDRIYGSALVNIVAADGTDAYAGLNGIQSKHTPQSFDSADGERSFNQMSAKFKDGLSLIAPLHSDIKIDSTPWNKRAWTFQERLLSRRLIVFSQGQMTWHCRGMICREDMTVEDSGCSHTPLDWLGLRPRYLGVDAAKTWIDGNMEITRHGATHIMRSGTFVEYTKVIEEYTHRHMTFESDILDALAGLSHIFTLCFKSDMIHGLPRNLLDIALLWRPTQPLSRREDGNQRSAFPSWSWAGWVGRVSYIKPFKVTRHVDGSFERYEQDQNGEEGIRPLIRWHAWEEWSRRLEPINGNGRGFPFENPALPAEWENMPYYTDESGYGAPQAVPPVPAEAATNERALVFWTSSTSAFEIGAELSQQSDLEWFPQNPPKRFHLRLPDFGDVGSVLLDGAYIDMELWERQEFILIAEAQYLDLDDEIRDVEDCPYYVIMLVEWDIQRQFAKRLGLGRVTKTAWMLVSPRLKLVSLQ